VRCLIGLTVSSDRPFWFKWDAFMRHPNDLEIRNSQVVEDFYRSQWFHSDHGALYFNPPAFHFQGNFGYFINGRHRAILLARHLPLVPMSLTRIDAVSKSALDSCVSREIDQQEEFELPHKGQ
jgi:hypothetical protein